MTKKQTSPFLSELRFEKCGSWVSLDGLCDDARRMAQGLHRVRPIFPGQAGINIEEIVEPSRQAAWPVRFILPV